MIEPDSPTLEEFTSLMAARHAYIVQDYNARRSVLDSMESEILAKLDDLRLRHQAGICIAESYIIELLELELKCKDLEIELRDLFIDRLRHDVESNHIINPLQDRFTAYQTTKLDKYQKGNQHKSSASDEKWELANKLFKEEIHLHNTLKAARLASSRKAGVFAEERQLIRMMPNPR